jgi:hypothetical protein
MMLVEIHSSCGKLYSLETETNASVYALQQKLAQQTGMYISEQQLLTVEDTPLKWNQLLSEVTLPEQPRLKLTRKLSGVLNLKVKVYRRHVIELLMDTDSTVELIKRAIFERTRIPTTQQQLIFQQKELTDDMDIEGAGLENESTIELKECSCLDCPYRNRFY